MTTSDDVTLIASVVLSVATVVLALATIQLYRHTRGLHLATQQLVQSSDGLAKIERARDSVELLKRQATAVSRRIRVAEILTNPPKRDAWRIYCDRWDYQAILGDNFRELVSLLDLDREGIDRNEAMLVFQTLDLMLAKQRSPDVDERNPKVVLDRILDRVTDRLPVWREELAGLQRELWSSPPDANNPREAI